MGTNYICILHMYSILGGVVCVEQLTRGSMVATSVCLCVCLIWCVYYTLLYNVVHAHAHVDTNQHKLKILK